MFLPCFLGPWSPASLSLSMPASGHLHIRVLCLVCLSPQLPMASIQMSPTGRDWPWSSISLSPASPGTLNHISLRSLLHNIDHYLKLSCLFMCVFSVGFFVLFSWVCWLRALDSGWNPASTTSKLCPWTSYLASLGLSCLIGVMIKGLLEEFKEYVKCLACAWHMASALHIGIPRFFLKIYLFYLLFIFGCVGSLFLHAGFL